MPLHYTIKTCQLEFESRFGGAPISVAYAPGRVNLIGEHIDYNDGIVLPMAIDRYTVVVGAENQTRTCRFYSTHSASECVVDLNKPISPGPSRWGNYLAGVLFEFQKREIAIPGFDAVIHSSVPVGSGLSSSAALEVSLATFLEGVMGVELPKSEKALLCQKAENDFAGVPCGIMDQFASVYGKAQHLIQLDCQSQEVDLVSWPDEDIVVLITNSKAPRRLVDGEYAARRKQAANARAKLRIDSYRELSIEELESNRDRLSEVEYRRARHVVTEIQRTLQCAKCISLCHWELAGKLLYESHYSLRDDFEVSCNELDGLVQIAEEIGMEGGVFGSRMTGGGFGGCTVSLVSASSLNQVKESMKQGYESRFGIKPTVFATVPSQGAGFVGPGASLI